MLLQYAREHHFPNPTFFVDDGVSGVTYDRPGFQAMLAEIEAGRVAVAIAKDLSRLGRNSALTGLYTNFTFPQNGVRFIAINDNYDTIDPNRVDNDFAGIKNWFNEFYARDTSRKIRAVQKAKGERGVPLTTNVPYGYVKDLENPRRWVVDPVAADVVKRIFDLCMKGRGPMQIANQLKADKVLTPSAYRALQGIKTPNKKPEDPCDWHNSTVVAILERREYTGCTVNFKTYTNSIWDKKQRDNPLEKQAISPIHMRSSSRKPCLRRYSRCASSGIAIPVQAEAASFPGWCTVPTAVRSCIKGRRTITDRRARSLTVLSIRSTRTSAVLITSGKPYSAT